MIALSSPRVEESAVAQPRENPAFGHLHADFHLGLVTRFTHPLGQNREPVVLGEVVVRGIERRLVAVRLVDAALQIVGHGGTRHPAEELERAYLHGGAGAADRLRDLAVAQRASALRRRTSRILRMGNLACATAILP